ncbi:MAG TPA: hypothetical protein VGF67_23375 [Ktedonobacteraceae bacterium]|jgi:hypothetical protein
MIITLAGRRIDPRDAPIARFPLALSPAVGNHIRALLKEQGATMLVSSAACGADLLALVAAGELGLRRRVILPFALDRFRACSVIDRPGDWGRLFDCIIADVRRSGDLVLMDKQKEDRTAFLSANRAILDEAQKLALRGNSGTRTAQERQILAVIVWDGQPRGELDFTLDFANEARARLIPVAEVLTR